MLGNTIANSSEELQNFNTYFLDNNYDAFKIDNAVKSNCLLFTMLYCYHKQDWKNVLPEIPEEAFRNLSYKLQTNYRLNFYHNQVHGADVVQMLYAVIFDLGLKEFSKLSNLDIFATLLSGAAHDVDHPGTNNVLEIKSKSKLALLYNDQSVLENHHAASLFFLLENASNHCDVLQFLTPDQKTKVRKMMIDNILGTDMTKHGLIVKEI